MLSQHDETLLSGLSNQQAALAAQGAALAQQVANKTNTTTVITSHQPNALSAVMMMSQGVMMQAAYPGQQFQVSGQPTTIAL